MKPKRSMCH